MTEKNGRRLLPFLLLLAVLWYGHFCVGSLPVRELSLTEAPAMVQEINK